MKFFNKLMENRLAYLIFTIVGCLFFLASGTLSIVLLTIGGQTNVIEIIMYLMLPIYLVIAYIVNRKGKYNLSVGCYLVPITCILLYDIYYSLTAIISITSGMEMPLLEIVEFILILLITIVTMLYFIHYILINYFDIKHRESLFKMNKYFIFIMLTLLIAQIVVSIFVNANHIGVLRIIIWITGDVSTASLLVLMHMNQTHVFQTKEGKI